VNLRLGCDRGCLFDDETASDDDDDDEVVHLLRCRSALADVDLAGRFARRSGRRPSTTVRLEVKVGSVEVTFKAGGVVALRRVKFQVRFKAGGLERGSRSA